MFCFHNEIFWFADILMNLSGMAKAHASCPNYYFSGKSKGCARNCFVNTLL